MKERQLDLILGAIVLITPVVYTTYNLLFDFHVIDLYYFVGICILVCNNLLTYRKNNR